MKCCLLSNTNPILISFITFTLFSDLALASFSYQQDCTRPLTPDTPLLAISSALPTHKDFINTINAKLEVMGETVHDKSFDSFTIMAQQLGELNQVLQNPAYQHLPGATKLYGHILAPLIHQIKPLQEFAKVVQDY
ncbi:MAG: hypothetical protein J6Y94_02465, partial [Bacteriovoracaceae bacterium]|nr:hypothetical protein [Bacteriovoracaceae bacterium]